MKGLKANKGCVVLQRAELALVAGGMEDLGAVEAKEGEADQLQIDSRVLFFAAGEANWRPCSG